MEKLKLLKFSKNFLQNFAKLLWKEYLLLDILVRDQEQTPGTYADSTVFKLIFCVYDITQKVGFDWVLNTSA